MYDSSKACKSDSEMTFHEMSISFSYELSHRIPYETHKRHPLSRSLHYRLTEMCANVYVSCFYKSGQRLILLK